MWRRHALVHVAAVDQAESPYAFGDGMAVNVTGEYMDDIVLSFGACPKVHGQCTVRGRHWLTGAQLIVILFDEESGSAHGST